MENYIVINGKKAELTEEQLKALGIEVKESSFRRAKVGESYYYIQSNGMIGKSQEYPFEPIVACYGVANYCTDKELLQQQAYREILNRLLWRYSMEHDGDKIDWNSSRPKHYICYSCVDLSFATNYTAHSKSFERVYFYTNKIAENAIKEIVEPFMAEHPDFKL